MQGDNVRGRREGAADAVGRRHAEGAEHAAVHVASAPRRHRGPRVHVRGPPAALRHQQRAQLAAQRERLRCLLQKYPLIYGKKYCLDTSLL